MNGVLVVVVVVMLVGMIGLGFGVLTSHQETSNQIAELKSQFESAKALNKQIVESSGDTLQAAAEGLACMNAFTTTEEERLEKIVASLQTLQEKINKLHNATIGTTDTDEFLRMKTQVWNVLTPSMEELQKVVGIPPKITISKDAMVEAAMNARKYENPALSFSKVLPKDDELTKIMFADLITKDEEKDNDRN